MKGCAFVAGSGITTGTVSAAGFISAVASTTSMTIYFNTTNTTVTAGSLAYAIYCPVIVTGGGTPQTGSTSFEYGESLFNLQVDCNSIAGAVGIANWFSGEDSEMDHVSVIGCTNIDIDHETPFSQNSGPYHNLTLGLGTGAPAGALLYVSRVSGGLPTGISNASISGNANTLIGFDLETPSEEVNGIHCEALLTCINAGGAGSSAPVTCPVACPVGFVSGGGFHLSDINGGGSSGTTLVHLAAGTFDAGLQNIHILGTYTNSLVDSQNSCTVTDTYLAKYVMDNNGALNESSSADSGCTNIKNGTITVTSSTTGTASLPFNNAPHCLLIPTSDPTSTGVYWATATASTLTAHVKTSGTITFNYSCQGNPN